MSNETIIVRRRSNPYSQIRREALTDASLSWKARGILSYFLSFQDETELSLQDLEQASEKDGIKALKSGLKELRQNGYAKLVTRQCTETGKILGKRYEVTECQTFTTDSTEMVRSVPTERPKKALSVDPRDPKRHSRCNIQVSNGLDHENSGEMAENDKNSTIYKEYSLEYSNTVEFAKKVIDHLNLKTDSRFKHTSKKTQSIIRARKIEGFDLDDFKAVINEKAIQWMHDRQMQKYLRPQTLFGTKFESYLQEANRKKVKIEKEKAELFGEFDDDYERYLEWVGSEFPTVAEMVLYMSKAQYVSARKEEHRSQLNVLGKNLKRQEFVRAHSLMEKEPNKREAYADVFALYDSICASLIKLSTVI